MKREFEQRSRCQFQSGAAGVWRNASGENSWSLCTDEDLLMRYARQGICEAFEELVHRYERELYNYLRKYLHSVELAEDAFQAVFLQVHLKCREFDPQRQFRPWLYRIATNGAIDLLRKNRRWSAVRLGPVSGVHALSEERRPMEDVAEARSTAPERRLELAEDIEQLRLLAESLPARLRDVVVLVMLQGLSYRKAADMLQIPVGTAKSRAHIAISRLRKIVVAAA